MDIRSSISEGFLGQNKPRNMKIEPTTSLPSHFYSTKRALMIMRSRRMEISIFIRNCQGYQTVFPQNTKKSNTLVKIGQLYQYPTKSTPLALVNQMV